MCGKTVKSFSGDQNKQCVKCTKLIHFKCDKEIGNELGEYFCPSCRKDSQDVDPEFSGFIVSHRFVIERFLFLVITVVFFFKLSLIVR